MKILLVYPQYPLTFWGFKYALKFISKKAGYPPLGLLTVAAMLPAEWEQKLADLNVRPLKDKDIAWADYVFISAMSVQRESAQAVIARCRALGKKIVAGGPLFTAAHEEFKDVDHFVLNEAEVTLPRFLDDLRRGCARPVYTDRQWADIPSTPIPRWDLIRLKDYAAMNIQYSRGCPFDCDFCDITVLYGRQPRTKTRKQVIAELESVYRLGWRDSVFFVDDNFIGNKAKLKNEILPAMIEWMESKKHPFILSTEASINLADDEELMRLMARAGFNKVFIGIESPHEASLEECRKSQNRNRDLIASVRKIQAFGMQVQGGFIVGFDRDPAAIFERLIEFIQESGIVTAMVGLLNAPRGTRLYQRLMHEGRLLNMASGSNTDFSINFIPIMNREALLSGYKNVLGTIYAPKHYYARIKRFMRDYKPRLRRGGDFRLQLRSVEPLFKSIVLMGVFGKERLYYWKLFFWSLFRRPKLFPLAITFSIYGFHFRKLFDHYARRHRTETSG